MNNEAINKRIQALESELAGLKAELSKPQAFIFNYKINKSYYIGDCNIQKGWSGISENLLNSFRYRQTEANANADLQLQKELMCIGALAEQIDPDYKSEVKFNRLTWNYYVYFSIPSNRYIMNRHIDLKILGVVYMPKDVAEKVCEILNNKEVNL